MKTITIFHVLATPSSTFCYFRFTYLRLILSPIISLRLCSLPKQNSYSRHKDVDTGVQHQNRGLPYIQLPQSRFQLAKVIMLRARKQLADIPHAVLQAVQAVDGHCLLRSGADGCEREHDTAVPESGDLPAGCLQQGPGKG